MKRSEQAGTAMRQAVLMGGALLVIAPGALAQQAPGAALEEVIVTAQRREERLQEVPISISAFSQAMLDARNVTGIGGIAGFAPNVKIYQGTYSTGATLSMRGAAEINPAPFFDPAVGIYLDGVYVGKAQGNLFDLADIDRIEVLRGPQGTLYGRNTFAGAINVISAKPTGIAGGTVKVGVGNYGLRRAKANLDLPRFGDFSVKLSGSYNTRKGYAAVAENPYTNVAQARPATVRRMEGGENRAGRVAVRFEPSDPLTFDYSFDHTLTDATPRATRLVAIAPAGLGGFFDPASPAYVGALVNGTYLGFPANLYVNPAYSGTVYANGGAFNRAPSENLRINAHALTGQLDLDGVTVKSITSYRRMDFSNVFDLDATPLPLASASLDNRFRQDSQEFQLIGSSGPVNFTGGLYFYEEKGRVVNMQQFFGNATTSVSRYSYGTKAYAAYGQADYVPGLLDGRLTLTAGLRYSHERKRMAATLDSVTATATTNLVAPGTRDAVSASGWTPTGILKYRLDADSNVYVKYAKGFKSGGFSLGSTQATALLRYAPETVDSYEAGLKSRFLGGQLQVNLAAYLNKINNYQVSVFANNGTLTVSKVDNAANATVKGFELETEATPFDWLRLNAALGYTEPRYNHYYELGVDLHNDRVFPYISNWTASAGADARLLSASWGELHLRLDYSHSSPYYTLAFSRQQLSPTVASSAQPTRAGVLNLLDVALQLTNVTVATGELGATLWAKNLTNVHSPMGGVDFGAAFGHLTTGFFNPPRTIGADISFKF